MLRVSVVRSTIRSLWKAKTFTIVAVATVAVGIGVPMAIGCPGFREADDEPGGPKVVLLTYAIVIVVFSLTAFAAAVVPARRALRVDPLVALRAE